MAIVSRRVFGPEAAAGPLNRGPIAVVRGARGRGLSPGGTQRFGSAEPTGHTDLLELTVGGIEERTGPFDIPGRPEL
jgi:hypothetical protein